MKWGDSLSGHQSRRWLWRGRLDSQHHSLLQFLYQCSLLSDHLLCHTVAELLSWCPSSCILMVQNMLLLMRAWLDVFEGFWVDNHISMDCPRQIVSVDVVVKLEYWELWGCLIEYQDWWCWLTLSELQDELLRDEGWVRCSDELWLMAGKMRELWTGLDSLWWWCEWGGASCWGHQERGCESESHWDQDIWAGEGMRVLRWGGRWEGWTRDWDWPGTLRPDWTCLEWGAGLGWSWGGGGWGERGEGVLDVWDCCDSGWGGWAEMGDLLEHETYHCDWGPVTWETGYHWRRLKLSCYDGESDLSEMELVTGFLHQCWWYYCEKHPKFEVF